MNKSVNLHDLFADIERAKNKSQLTDVLVMYTTIPVTEENEHFDLAAHITSDEFIQGLIRERVRMKLSDLVNQQEASKRIPTTPIRELEVQPVSTDYKIVLAQKYDHEDYAVVFTDDVNDVNAGFSFRGTFREIVQDLIDFPDVIGSDENLMCVVRTLLSFDDEPIRMQLPNYRLCLDNYVSYEDFIYALRDNGFVENISQDNGPVQHRRNGDICAIKTWHDPENGGSGVACTIDRLATNQGKEHSVGIYFYLYRGDRDNHSTFIPEEPFDFTPYAKELIDQVIIEVAK